jgi:DNA-binding LacI/PurR family transcriptional regulator
MAETAVNMLMARINGDEIEGNKVFPVKLWRGKSV